MSAGDVYKMALTHTFDEISFFVLTHHYVEQAGAGGAAERVASLWVDKCQTAYLATFSSRMALRQMEVQKIRPAGEDVIFTSINENGTLTDSAGSIASFVLAPVVSLRTGFAGRSKRGRNYMMPPTENHIDDDVIDTVLFNAITNYFTEALNLNESEAEPEFKLTVWSTKNELSQPVTSFIVRTVLGTQRRRKLGRGS